MKVSLLVFDLSDNCLVRTYPIARVLERRYEVEVIGPVFGKGIFKPFKDEFKYRSAEGKKYPSFFASIQSLLRKVDGDVVYSFKPRPTSFGIGLFRKLMNKTPLFLDIEDWEFGGYLPWGIKQLSKKAFLSLRDPNSVLPTFLMEQLSRFADEIFVASTFLQQRFGGTLLRHGADTDLFNPSKYDRLELREKWGIEDEKIILFAGTPRPHKGLEELILCLKSFKIEGVKLLIVGGNKEDPYTRNLIRRGNDKVIAIGYRPHSEMPKLLAIADLVVLPQRKTIYAMAQIPGKVFEAMAMGKPIVATRVSDLHEILQGCGLLVRTGNVAELADNILFLLQNEDIAKELGEKARERCIRKYSWNAMEEILIKVFEKYE